MIVTPFSGHRQKLPFFTLFDAQYYQKKIKEWIKDSTYKDGERETLGGVSGACPYIRHPWPAETQPDRHKIQNGVLGAATPNRKAHSSQPFGRYGKPKVSHGKCPPSLMANPASRTACSSPSHSRHIASPPLISQQVTSKSSPVCLSLIYGWSATCWDAVVGSVWTVQAHQDWLAFHLSRAMRRYI